MPKLQHFRNSKVARNLYEPIYQNLFEVIITPPTIIENDPEWGSVNRELILEQVTNINGLDVDKIPGLVTQKFKGTERKFIGVVPDSTTVNITMTFEMNLNDNNQNFVYNALRKWSDLCYDPLTGAQTLKKDYTSKVGMSITAFNKEASVHRKWEIKNIFPSVPIPQFDFAYDQNNPLQLTISFHGDYFGNQYA